ncbi:MAG: RodZ domain-containing protein [Vicinamibacterales bacterium]
MTDETSPLDFGSRMKRAREARGVSLQEIAARTKISASALEALERNDISRLPGGIFGRGFVRAYAEEIGLDPEQAVREFVERFPHDAVTVGSPYVPPEDHAAVESSRKRAETALKLAAIVVPVAIVIGYLTLTYRSAEPAVTETPVASAPVGSAATVPSEAVSVRAAPLAIELLAVSSVNVTLIADGVPQGDRALTEGQRLTLSVDRALTLSVADAGAVQLRINGQAAVPLGRQGEPRTVQIDRETFDSLLAPQ